MIAQATPSKDITIKILSTENFVPNHATFTAPRNPVPIEIVKILKVGDRKLGSVEV